MSRSSSKIRVVLVDDHSTIHLEIGALLKSFDDLELVGQGRTGLEAVRLSDEYQPDIILMDMVMPVMNGIDATRLILERHPQIKIIAMSGFDDRDTVQAMLDAGAVGYILKTAHPEDLVNSLRAVYDGQSVLSREVMKTILSRPESPARDYGLTRRELEILRLMVEGKTNPEIASALTISASTVKFHTSNIFQKLGVESRAAAIVLAAKQNLV